ncbi:MAG: HAD family hydrolase [Hungatella sp.]
MMNKTYVLFDLDGTLTDPMIGITKSVQYALHAYGIEVEDLRELCPFIGPPLKDSFIEFYQFSETQASEAIQKYREYFAVTGLYENLEYPGIKEMLSHLRAAGKILLVATSKPELFARQILEHFQLDPYFEDIGGSNMDETRVKKADVIAYLLEKNHITDPTRVVMVGDRKHDILGAKALGIDSVGVLYGYGDRAELELAGADHIVATVAELEALLC